MNVTDAIEIVLEHCAQSIDDGDPGKRKELTSAIKRLERKLRPLVRARCLRTGSFRTAKDQYKIRCGCNRVVVFWMMYRCLYCGEYYCKSCGEIHFGRRVPTWQESQQQEERKDA